jgi:hypothetical protein
MRAQCTSHTCKPTRHLVGLNALTDFILRARGRYVPNPPNIARITPSTVSACADTATFIIEGHNLWRGVQIYAGGVALDSVEVLPDMRGIKVTLKMVDIHKNGANIDAAKSDAARSHVDVIPISVVTRDGVSTRKIAIQGQRRITQVNGQATTICDTPLIADEILYKEALQRAEKSQQTSEDSNKPKGAKGVRASTTKK